MMSPLQFATALIAQMANTTTNGVQDRTAEQRSLEAAKAAVVDLMSDDPTPLREHLAESLVLLEAIAALYMKRGVESSSPNATAAYVGIALRALAQHTKTAVVFGALAPKPAKAIFEEIEG